MGLIISFMQAFEMHTFVLRKSVLIFVTMYNCGSVLCTISFAVILIRSTRM